MCDEWWQVSWLVVSAPTLGPSLAVGLTPRSYPSPTVKPHPFNVTSSSLIINSSFFIVIFQQQLVSNYNGNQWRKIKVFIYQKQNNQYNNWCKSQEIYVKITYGSHVFWLSICMAQLIACRSWKHFEMTLKTPNTKQKLLLPLQWCSLKSKAILPSVKIEKKNPPIHIRLYSFWL